MAWLALLQTLQKVWVDRHINPFCSHRLGAHFGVFYSTLQIFILTSISGACLQSVLRGGIRNVEDDGSGPGELFPALTLIALTADSVTLEKQES